MLVHNIHLLDLILELDAPSHAGHHLILFGDPGSNSVMAKIVGSLPVIWKGNTISISGSSYSTAEYGLSLIFPNPLNQKKYVVLNSGHTFHA